MKDKKYEEALNLIEKASTNDTFNVFLKSHTLLAMKKPREAIENLMKESSGSLKENGLLKNEGYVVFLFKTAITHQISFEFVRENLLKHIAVNEATEFTLLHLSEYY